MIKRDLKIYGDVPSDNEAGTFLYDRALSYLPLLSSLERKLLPFHVLGRKGTDGNAENDVGVRMKNCFEKVLASSFGVVVKGHLVHLKW